LGYGPPGVDARKSAVSTPFGTDSTALNNVKPEDEKDVKAWQDKAARFVTMIDTFYEKKVKFICSAATAPSGLYVEGDGAFEFQRTVSRLMEMQSPEYLALDHIA
jgi:predicted ATPase